MAAKCAANKAAKKAEQAKKVSGARILLDEHGVKIGVALPHGTGYHYTCSGGHLERLSAGSTVAKPQVQPQVLQKPIQALGTRRPAAMKYNLKRRKIAGKLDND